VQLAGGRFGGIFLWIVKYLRIFASTIIELRTKICHYDVYNKDKVCQFCPVPKNELVAIAKLCLWVLPQFTIIESSNLKVESLPGVKTLPLIWYIQILLQKKFRSKRVWHLWWTHYKMVANPVTLSFAFMGACLCRKSGGFIYGVKWSYIPLR